MPERHTLAIRGRRVLMVMEHADSVAILGAAGWQAPKIPPDCNTVRFHFVTADDRPALATNQTGFAPTATDDERQVNGCTLAILLDPFPDLSDSNEFLDSFIREIEAS